MSDRCRLRSVSVSGRATEAASLTGDFTDLAAGPGNTLEAADNSGTIVRCKISRRPSARCRSVAVPAKFDAGQVAAIGQAGGRVWFTDDAGELGSLSTSGNRFGGPFGDLRVKGQTAGEASADAGTITTDLAGWLYVAGGQGSDPLFENDLIRMINPHDGKLQYTYSRGLTNVVALTGGGDGNIWFLDEKNPITGAANVGMLDTSTGQITESALPREFRLPRAGAAISPGPAGSNTVFFTLQSAVGAHPAVGEVTGL